MAKTWSIDRIETVKFGDLHLITDLESDCDVRASRPHMEALAGDMRRDGWIDHIDTPIGWQNPQKDVFLVNGNTRLLAGRMAGISDDADVRVALLKKRPSKAEIIEIGLMCGTGRELTLPEKMGAVDRLLRAKRTSMKSWSETPEGEDLMGKWGIPSYLSLTRYMRAWVRLTTEQRGLWASEGWSIGRAEQMAGISPETEAARVKAAAAAKDAAEKAAKEAAAKAAAAAAAAAKEGANEEDEDAAAAAKDAAAKAAAAAKDAADKEAAAKAAKDAKKAAAKEAAAKKRRAEMCAEASVWLALLKNAAGVGHDASLYGAGKILADFLITISQGEDPSALISEIANRVWSEHVKHLRGLEEARARGGAKPATT